MVALDLLFFPGAASGGTRGEVPGSTIGSAREIFDADPVQWSDDAGPGPRGVPECLGTDGSPEPEPGSKPEPDHQQPERPRRTQGDPRCDLRRDGRGRADDRLPYESCGDRRDELPDHRGVGAVA